VDELEHEIAVVRSEHRPCTAPEEVGPAAHRRQEKRDMDADGEGPDARTATHSAAWQRTTVDAAGPQLDRLRTASEASLSSTETASPISDRDAIRGGLRAAAEGRILGDDGERARRVAKDMSPTASRVMHLTSRRTLTGNSGQ
jgi:hypothetical protein